MGLFPCIVIILALESKLMEQPPPGNLLITTLREKTAIVGLTIVGQHLNAQPKVIQFIGQKWPHDSIQPVTGGQLV